MLMFSTLDFGNPTDARTWEAGCRSLGMAAESSLLTPSPGSTALAGFFAAEPDWVYFSGHFAGGLLWGDGGESVRFQPDRVVVGTGEAESELLKGDGFRMHLQCTLLVWGGCSACASAGLLRSLRELFVDPTILGYSGSTGWQINDAMLGGGFIRPHFFANLRRHGPPPYDSGVLVDAWLRAARWGYGGGSIEEMFRAIDSGGQEWKVVGGKVKKGRTL